MFTNVGARMCVASVHSRHVSRDPWWWIRAGTNVLVHLWNENQGRRDRQRRAPSNWNQASCRHKLTLYGLMVHTHTHIITPPTASFLFSFLLETSAQNRPDSRTIVKATGSARHVWPRTSPKKDAMNTHTKKEKSSTAHTSGERFPKFNKEVLQYSYSIIYCDMTDVFLSSVWWKV